MSGKPGDHAAKREALVEGAIDVLRARGLAGCTARRVAAAAGMSTSTIHYYFGGVDQVVDAAFRRMVGTFLDRLDKIAANHDDPVDALWAVCEAFLRIGSDRQLAGRPRDVVPMLWFEFHVAASRSGDTATVCELAGRMSELFGRLVEQVGVPDPEAHSQVLVSALLGSVARSTTDAPSQEATEEHLGRALGLPPRHRPRAGADPGATEGGWSYGPRSRT